MRSNIQFYKVKIKNWEKWNGGNKTTEWFKLSTSFTNDPKVFALNNSEFRLFVSLLTLAGSSQSDQVQFTRSSMTVHCRFRGSSLARSLANLSELGLIEIQKERKKEKKERKIAHFNFDELYAQYPRKLGKHAAFKKLNSIIKTQKDFDQFKKAVNRFAEKVAKEKTEKQFIPHFSTFVNSKWQDYLDDDADTVSSKAIDEQKKKDEEKFNELWGDV